MEVFNQMILSQVAEATSQSDSNTSEFTGYTSPQPNFLFKITKYLTDRRFVSSSNTCSQHIKVFSQSNNTGSVAYPKLRFSKHFLPFPAIVLVLMFGLNSKGRSLALERFSALS
jgi:hypothetical protein